jgi:hypothetical protein
MSAGAAFIGASSEEVTAPPRVAGWHGSPFAGRFDRVGGMSVGAAIALGAVTGLALGILVSVITDLPLAPEAGLVVGALIGWLSRRDGA